MICLVTENKKGAKGKEIDDHSDIMFYILKQRKNQDPNRDLLFYFSYFIGDQTGLFFQREEKGLTWLGVRSNNEIFVIENRRKSNKKSNACHDWGHQYFEWLPRNFLKFRESSHKFSGLNDRVLGVGTDSAGKSTSLLRIGFACFQLPLLENDAVFVVPLVYGVPSVLKNFVMGDSLNHGFRELLDKIL